MNVVDGYVCGGNVALGVVELAVNVVFSVAEVDVALVVDLIVEVLGCTVVGTDDARVESLGGATSLRGRGALSESSSSSKSSPISILLLVAAFSVVLASLAFSEVSDGL